MVLIFLQDKYLKFAISPSNSIRSLEIVKLQKSNHSLKKVPKVTLITTTLFNYFPSFKKISKGLFLDKHKNFLAKAKFSIGFNLFFFKKHSSNTCLNHITDKITTRFDKGLSNGMIITTTILLSLMYFPVFAT